MMGIKAQKGRQLQFEQLAQIGMNVDAISPYCTNTEQKDSFCYQGNLTMSLLIFTF